MIKDNGVLADLGALNKRESDSPSAWMISSKFGAYSEVWMYRQARLMRRLSVTVMTRDHQNRHAFPADGFFIRQSPIARGIFANAGLNWVREQVRYQVHHGRGGLPFAAAEERWWDEQAKLSPSVVLLHYGPTAVAFGRFLHQRSIPFITHFHGYDLSSLLRNRRYYRRLKHILPMMAGCVVVADYMRVHLINMGMDDRKIWNIPCGTPVYEQPLARRSDSPTVRFLAVGRMIEKKRPDLTIRAFALVAQQTPATELVMVGDGPMLSGCRSLAVKLGISEYVHFCGRLMPDGVRNELSKASVFVQHSVTSASGDMEGWPVAIAEAAAVGLPVVATRHASIPEQVEDGVSGLLCDEGDWKGMGKQMMRLATDERLRLSMSTTAQSRMSMFNVDDQVTRLEQVLLNASSDR